MALGIADGLSYLHNVCPRRIIHRDIKASNILLSRDFDAQVNVNDITIRFPGPT